MKIITFEMYQYSTSQIEDPTSTILFYYIYLGFNKCPNQILRSYKRHEENKSKIGQGRSSMQQADYQCHRPTP